MYIQHAPKPTLCYKFKYFTPDASVFKSTVLNHGDAVSSSESMKKQAARPFLEPDENAFAHIRNRLSTLTLRTAYKTRQEPYMMALPFQREVKLPPRRISSISSHDTMDRNGDPQYLTKPRIHSRNSFMSEDIEIRNVRRHLSLPKHRASETAALQKLNENFLTPGQNPELFSRQIKLNDKPEKHIGRIGSPRSTSPKSAKSDSSGKVHLSLIESLDLNEKLHDVEKVKERYSNNTFMNSLTLYKLRGHDRCLKHDGMTDHIPRGTRIGSPESSRVGSKMSFDSAYAMTRAVSPKPGDRLLPSLNVRWQWEPDKSHVNNECEDKTSKRPEHSRCRKRSPKRKKIVGFDMEPKELTEDDQHETMPPNARDVTTNGIKSILKRSTSQSAGIDQHKLNENVDDEFVANESYYWKYQLPKVRSPVHPIRERHTVPFSRKMYHFGDGVSNEFEQVISKYGNCRQGSWVRDKSCVKDRSFTSQV